MSRFPRRPLEPGTCFREVFIERFDVEFQEAIRLFGRVLDDLVFERSLGERGPREDRQLELAATVREISARARILETLGADAMADPLDDGRIGSEAQRVGAAVAELVSELEATVELPNLPERRQPRPSTLPKKSSRRRHLKPVPDPPPSSRDDD